MDAEEAEPTFDEFKAQWMVDVVKGSPSTVELGRRFALKMIKAYFNLAEDSDLDDLHYCDGSGDGGIDIAYLERGSNSQEAPDSAKEGESAEGSGATWYLVQSKYGKSFQGTRTIFEEGRKILDTLDGTRTQLSSVTQNVLNLLIQFRQQAGKQDRIKLLFVTEKSLTDAASENALDDLRAMGKSRLGDVLDVESISLENVYDQISPNDDPALVSVLIKGNLVQDGDLLAGLVSLPAMYDFLRAFKQEAGGLDKLYEKNVRSYLRRRRKVNGKIRETLLNSPERFGLYNNGITVVVKDFLEQNGEYLLAEPYVVNGCQTTSTIFDTFAEKTDTGATGIPYSATSWYKQTEKGNVIVKIVKVASADASQDASLLKNITTFTNTQNVISEKDFLALNPTLQKWVKEMRSRDIFLEIQKGSWDAQLAKQKGRTRGVRYTEDQYANAFELLKIFGAGWLSVPGVAWHQNNAFLPDGKSFNDIVYPPKGEEEFGADDLLAAFHLQKASYQNRFGRRATQDSRRVTRFLFYFVVVHLIKELAGQDSRRKISQAILNLSKPENEKPRQYLLDAAVGVIDDYLTPERSNSVYKEESYTGNLNTFMKSQQLGQDLHQTPYLAEHLRFAITFLSRSASGQSAKPIDEIKAALKP